MQHTLKTATQTLHGIGLHTGANVTLRILPAAPNTGVIFVRTDLTSVNTYVPAHIDHVNIEQSNLCTMLRNDADVTIQTPEHLMSALAGCGIDNALIEISASEVPLMDGSAKPFAKAIMAVGRKVQPASRATIKILKTVRVENNDRVAEISPSSDDCLTVDFTVDFPGLGTQCRRFAMTDVDVYMSDIADARTFTLRSIAEALKAQGKVVGGSLDNALVLNDEDGTAYQGTKRHVDEPVRHKILDAIGDLMLAGMPIEGQFKCVRGGHALTASLLRALLADRSAYIITQKMAGMNVSGAHDTVSDTAEAAIAS